MSSEAWNMVSYEEAEEDDSVTLSPEFTSCTLVDALHDSPFRMVHAARCFLGTHVRAKQDLSTWLATYSPHNRHPEAPAPGRSGKPLQENFRLLWFHGAVGTGKTTLMQTLADALLPPSTTLMSVSDDVQAIGPPTYQSDEFDSTGVQYGGTAVFLSKERQLNDATKVLATVALGLASRLPPLAAFIQSAFEANKSLFQSNSIGLREQAEVLIFNPVQTWVVAEEGEVDVDLMIIIDGLDECDNKEMQTEIVRIVRDLCTERIEGVRWSWVFSSRTEMRLREALVGNHAPQMDEILVELASDAEMDAFLNCGFAQIRAMHDIYPMPVDGGRTSSQTAPSPSLARTHEEWPTPHDKISIRWQTAGLYGATASILDYIARSDDDPRARIVLIDSFVGNKDPGADHPFARLDTLYKNILASVPLASVSMAKRILGAVSCLQPSSHEQKRPTVSLIVELFGMNATDVHQALYDLHSVVSAPCGGTLGTSRRSSLSACPPYGDGRLSFRHPSFDQFLRTPSRSLEWALNLESVHLDLARSCLKKLALGNIGFRSPQERWYIHCWRTGKDTEAAFGILPDLFEFDYTLLSVHSTVDRYFVEWLLYLQESTMSEYQLLNPGPLIKLRARRSSTSNDAYSPNNNQPSASSSSSASTPSRSREKRMGPPRRSYILGYEPSKQIYLVPFYDEKVQARAEIGLLIGPGLKYWDWIRGFQVIPRNGGEYMELVSGEQDDVTG